MRLPSMLQLAFVCTAVVLLAGCGGSRRYGDADGQPVAFSIDLQRPFVSDMHRRRNASVGVGMSMNSSGHTSTGVGIGLSFQSTNVYVLGHADQAKALLFRRKLSWGENSFTVPLLPERVVNLEIEVTGGRSGRERIGQVRANQEQPIRITLDSAGSSLLTLDATKETVPASEMPASQETPAPASGE